VIPYSIQHRDKVQFWVKFASGAKILMDYQKARNAGESAMWCGMWRGMGLVGVPNIERIEDRITKYIAVVVDDEPCIETDRGLYSLKEAYGTEWIPSETELQQRIEAVRNSWSEAEAQSRQSQRQRIVHLGRASHRDKITFEVWARRRLVDGDV
jgi:hypothetical protein